MTTIQATVVGVNLLANGTYDFTLLFQGKNYVFNLTAAQCPDLTTLQTSLSGIVGPLVKFNNQIVTLTF